MCVYICLICLKLSYQWIMFTWFIFMFVLSIVLLIVYLSYPSWLSIESISYISYYWRTYLVASSPIFSYQASGVAQNGHMADRHKSRFWSCQWASPMMVVNLCVWQRSSFYNQNLWWLRCNNCTLNMILFLHVCCFWCSGLMIQKCGKIVTGPMSHISWNGYCCPKATDIINVMMSSATSKWVRVTFCWMELAPLCANFAFDRMACKHLTPSMCRPFPLPRGPSLCHAKGRARFLGKDHLAYYTWDILRLQVENAYINSVMFKTLSRSQKGLNNLTILDRKMAKCLQVRRCWDSNSTLGFSESKASKPMLHI